MTIARRYAAALLANVPQGPARHEVLHAAATLALAIQDAELSAAVQNPRLGAVRRAELAEMLAKAVKAPQPLHGLLKVVAENGRLAMLGAILDEVRAQAEAAEGIVRADVQSAVPLTDTQKIQLKVQLKAATKARDVHLHEQVVPALKGGVRVLFDGKVWDMTVAGRMARLKAHLQQALQQ